jgi:thiamine pyrophosphokinase
MSLSQNQRTILNLALSGESAYLKWCELVDGIEAIQIILPLATNFTKNLGPAFFVDGGTIHLPQAPSPHYFCLGDGDSSSEKKMQLLFPSSKDYTDLELALALIPGHFKQVSIHGVWGKRKDHELANLGAINSFLINHSSIMNIQIDNHHYFLNSGAHTLDIKGKFSLLVFQDTTVDISGNCQFTTDKKITMNVLNGRGLSNFGSGKVEISLNSSALLYMAEGTNCISVVSSLPQSLS